MYSSSSEKGSTDILVACKEECWHKTAETDSTGLTCFHQLQEYLEKTITVVSE